MKRWGPRVGAVFCVLLLLAGLAIWNTVFRTPPVSLRPMPESLISAETTAGRQLLAEAAFTADHDALMRHFVSQSRPAFCGVASAVTVLNALEDAGPAWTQSSFFTDAARRVRHPLQVTFGGMTLAELEGLLRAHDLDTSRVHASESDVASFRSMLQQNLATAGDFVIVNYERASLGQLASGHISPLAAYDEKSDRVLILDVAAYKYAPAWVPVDMLWRAMATRDPASGKTRGFVVVRAKANR